jgi:hypothetical protein
MRIVAATKYLPIAYVNLLCLPQDLPKMPKK